MTEPQTIKLEISSKEFIEGFTREVETFKQKIEVLLVVLCELVKKIDAIEQHPALSIPPLSCDGSIKTTDEIIAEIKSVTIPRVGRML